MTDAHLDTELLVDMLCQMLGGIDGTVLTTSAAEGEHQRGESALDIPTHMGIVNTIYRIEEGEYLTVVLEETDNRLVKTRQFLVWLIASRVMG